MAVDEVGAVEAHGMEVEDMITMAMVVVRIDGEVCLAFFTVDSIDCCCSGAYHL